MDFLIDNSRKKRRKRVALLIAVSALLILSGALILLNNRGTQIKRPQEPFPPFPYLSEAVTFHSSRDDISFAGTLTIPSKPGKYPAVVLISGSGPQNRDSEFAGHKPFLVLSDYLTRNGIAVLRYDDRGVGQSTGNFANATSLDFSYDVESAIDYLKTRPEIQADKIGLVGHSDGGMVAPIVAARSTDVHFIVLLAGPGLQGEQLLLSRQESVEKKLGFPEAAIKNSKAQSEQIFQIVISSNNKEETRAALEKFSKERYHEIPDYAIPPGLSKDQFIAMQIDLFSSAWFKYFITYDPATTLERVKCAVLALNGALDVQVPSKDNLAAINNSLRRGGNQNFMVLEIPGLNHAFQECTTGMPDEYANIEQTFSPIALAEIKNWIARQVH